MIKFDLIDKYYIRALDSLNYVLCKTYTNKKGKEVEERLTHHGTVESAFNYAIEIYLKKACIKHKEISKVYSLLDRLDEVKMGITSSKEYKSLKRASKE